MRLINTKTFELEEFFDDSIPEYAILSHTWRQGEVLFGDWNNHKTRKAKAGWTKVKNACRQARHCIKVILQSYGEDDEFDDFDQDEDKLEADLMYELDYIWIDSVCIDKSSSAELSEAINSMYTWYQAAEVCFVYLDDFRFDGTYDRLQNCRWFTRGWTLQELLAPEFIIVFDTAWLECGRICSGFSGQTTPHLLCQFSTITGIATEHFKDRYYSLKASIAERMSWAAKRHTSRSEDMAYCLMGIFEVNMPLLYGEGSAAFVRLQEEIIKHSSDRSIFLWNAPMRYRRSWEGCLAPSVDSFAAFERHRLKLRPSGAEYNIEDYGITNCGLRIRLPVLFCGEYGAGRSRQLLLLAVLCDFEVLGHHPAIFLQSAGSAEPAGSFSELDVRLSGRFTRKDFVFMVPIAWAARACPMKMTLRHERRSYRQSIDVYMKGADLLGLLPIYVEKHVEDAKILAKQVARADEPPLIPWYDKSVRAYIWLNRVDQDGMFVAIINGEWRTSHGKRICLQIHVQVKALLKQAITVIDAAQTEFQAFTGTTMKVRPILIEFPRDLESLIERREPGFSESVPFRLES